MSARRIQSVWARPIKPNIHTVGRRVTVEEGFTVFVLFTNGELESFTVEAGFEHDGASVPWPLPHDASGETPPAAHDKLYRTLGFNGRFSRGECDVIYRELMRNDDVHAAIRETYYAGCRVGGWRTWRKYERARK